MDNSRLWQIIVAAALVITTLDKILRLFDRPPKKKLEEWLD